MKIPKLFNILLLFALAIPVLSCKDEDNELEVASKAELLTHKEWVGQAFHTTWKLKLNRDGTYSNVFNGIPDETGTWELSKIQKEIILDKGTVNEMRASITKHTSTELHLTTFWELPSEKGEMIKTSVEMRFGH